MYQLPNKYVAFETGRFCYRLFGLNSSTAIKLVVRVVRVAVNQGVKPWSPVPVINTRYRYYYTARTRPFQMEGDTMKIRGEKGVRIYSFFFFSIPFNVFARRFSLLPSSY